MLTIRLPPSRGGRHPRCSWAPSKTTSAGVCKSRCSSLWCTKSVVPSDGGRRTPGRWVRRDDRGCRWRGAIRWVPEGGHRRGNVAIRRGDIIRIRGTRRWFPRSSHERGWGRRWDEFWRRRWWCHEFCVGLEGRRGWRRWRGNERRRGARSGDLRLGRNRRSVSRPAASSQDGRNISPVILTRSQSFDRLRGSRRGRNAGARTWPRPTIILLNDGFFQVGDLANIATPHPHVDHSGSLALGNLALRFALLLRNCRRQQAIIVLKKVHKQHCGRGERIVRHETAPDPLVACRSWIDLSFSIFGLKTPRPKARANLEIYTSLLSGALVLSMRLSSEVSQSRRNMKY